MSPQQSQVHATEITHRSSAALHEGAVSLHEYRNRFVGSIVSVDGELRAGGKYDRKVFTATLEDETAPIRVVAWGAKAEELLELVDELERREDSDPGSVWQLQMELFAVGPERGMLPGICNIQTIQTLDASSQRTLRNAPGEPLLGSGGAGHI